MGGKTFAERQEGYCLKVRGQNGQECAADEREIGQQVGLAGVRTIFPH